MNLFKSPRVTFSECLVPVIPQLRQDMLFFMSCGTLTDQDDYSTMYFIRKEPSGEQYLFNGSLTTTRDYAFGKNEKRVKTEMIGDLEFGTEDRQPDARIRLSPKDYILKY